MKEKIRLITGLTVLFFLLFSKAYADQVLVDDGLGVLDTGTNLEWTQNGNLLQTQAANYTGGASAFIRAVINASSGVIHDTPNSSDNGTYTLSASDFDTNTGTMDWWGAQAWIGYLNNTDYAGHNDWRLPTVSPINGIAFNYSYSNNGSTDKGYSISGTASELGHLYYITLGNIAQFDTAGNPQAGYGLIHTGLFQNVQNNDYWNGTEYAPVPFGAWVLDGDIGFQNTFSKSDQTNVYALAVRTAQITPVPIPSVIWMFCSSLVGLRYLNKRSQSLLGIILSKN